MTFLALTAISRDNPMINEKVKALSQEARKLAPAERAAITDDLIASLDRPAPKVDAVWAKEAEERLAAHDRGEMAAHEISDVIRNLRAR